MTGWGQMMNESKRDLKVAVVGLGYWGPNRLRALSNIEHVDVSWICDLDRDRLAHHARQHPTSSATQEIDVLLADSELDAIILATPVLTHHSLACKAIEAGKHVFVEKPLAPSSGEARDLFARAAAHNIMLMCGHTFLYSPAVRTIKQILDRGELGELHFVSSNRVNLGPYRSDVSVIFDLGAHDFSILRYLLDTPPESVSAVGRDVIADGVADVAFVDLIHPDGLLAHVELSWLAPSKLRRTVIVGSEKMLVYEDGSTEPIRIYDSGIEYQDPSTYGEYQLSYRTGDIVSLRIDTTEPIVAELRDFIIALTEQSEPVSNAAIALDVIRTVEAAEASMNDGGRTLAVGREGTPATGRIA